MEGVKLAVLAWILLGCRLHAQPVVPIGAVQGSGDASPLAGQRVTVQGIVTERKSNGFFLQTPDGEADLDPLTSEGLFVFTSSAPPAAVAAGNAVQVSGTVAEFQGLTELTGPSITLLSTGNPLPSPITLAGGAFEPYEGMRVRVDSLTVVAPTGGSVSEANAISNSNGIFFGVVAGTARPFREPGIEPADPLPDGAPCCVPRWDGNPERLRVTGGPDVAARMSLQGLTGVLDYTSRSYTILLESGSYEVAGMLAAEAVHAPAADEFTIASFNLERFFDTTNDPGASDAVLTPAAYENRLRKAALLIRDVLRLPDILAVQEAENLGVLQDIATRLNASYTAYLAEGNDPGGIDVGFLVKSSRVTTVNVTQEGKAATYAAPSGSRELLNDRPPLILRATVGSFPITVVVNHLRSLTGIDDPGDGPRVRAKRRAQAEFLANLVQERQLADPAERIVVLGDFNAFPFGDGYVDVVGTVRGAPTPAANVTLASPDLVGPDLVDASESLPAATQYSYVFDGSAQTLDHVLFTQNLQPYFVRLERARVNADFPEVYRNDPSRPERLSDHDPAVAYFRLSSAEVGVGIAPASAPIAGRTFTYRVNVWNTSASPSRVTVSTTTSDAAVFATASAPDGWTCGARAVCSRTLAAGAFESLTVNVRLRQAANGAALTVGAEASSGAATRSVVIVASPPTRVSGGAWRSRAPARGGRRPER